MLSGMSYMSLVPNSQLRPISCIKPILIRRSSLYLKSQARCSVLYITPVTVTVFIKHLPAESVRDGVLRRK